jgi:hypothetical protein
MYLLLVKRMTSELKPMSREELRQMAEPEFGHRETVIRRIINHMYMDVQRSAKKNRTRVECFAWWDNAKLHTYVSRLSHYAPHKNALKHPFWHCPETITFELSYIEEILHRLRQLFPDCSVTYTPDTWRWTDPGKTSGKNGVSISVSW